MDRVHGLASLRRARPRRRLCHVPDHGLRDSPLRHRIRTGQQARQHRRGERRPDSALHVHLLQNTVDQKKTKDVDITYGIEVAGPWGGKWRCTLKDGKFTYEPEKGNFEGCDALFSFASPQEEVLTHFGRYPGGSASGDPEAIEKARHAFFPF